MITYRTVCGFFNVFCLATGAYAGFILRDEIYYPNIVRVVDLVEEFEKQDALIEEEILGVQAKIDRVKGRGRVVRK